MPSTVAQPAVNFFAVCEVLWGRASPPRPTAERVNHLTNNERAYKQRSFSAKAANKIYVSVYLNKINCTVQEIGANKSCILNC